MQSEELFVHITWRHPRAWHLTADVSGRKHENNATRCQLKPLPMCLPACTWCHSPPTRTLELVTPPACSCTELWLTVSFQDLKMRSSATLGLVLGLLALAAVCSAAKTKDVTQLQVKIMKLRLKYSRGGQLDNCLIWSR